MGWLFWLLLAVAIAGFAAVTGLKPKGTRQVEHTQLLGVARGVLIVFALIVAYLAYHVHNGG